MLVRFDPTRTDWMELATTLSVLPALDSRSTNDLMTLPVRYDGEDLAAVAQSSNLSVAEVIRCHSSATYRVAFDGFSPGFAYLLGLPPNSISPTRNTSHPNPGGFAGNSRSLLRDLSFCLPGGWHLLGTSNAELFNPTEIHLHSCAPECSSDLRLRVEHQDPQPRSSVTRSRRWPLRHGEVRSSCQRGVRSRILAVGERTGRQRRTWAVRRGRAPHRSRSSWVACASRQPMTWSSLSPAHP